MAGSNPKTYEQRLKCFHSGFCPYCGSAATLTKNETDPRKWTGLCSVNGHTNYFTNKKAIERVVGE